MPNDFQFIAMEDVTADDTTWTLHNVAVLGELSKNKRRYPLEVRKRAMPLYEGVQVFANHDPNTRVRRVEDLVGTLHGIFCEGSLIKAREFRLIPGDPLSIKVRAAARMNPKIIGLSHEAVVTYKHGTQNGESVVESIDAVKRVAVVTESAATATMYESVDPENNEMDPKDLTIEALTQARPDLVNALKTKLTQEVTESVTAEVNKTVGADARVVALESQIVELKKAPTDKDATIARLQRDLANRDVIEAVITETKVPPAFVTPLFRKQLLACEDRGQMVELCKDRVILAGPTVASRIRSDASESVGNSNDKQPTRDEVRAALR